MRDFGKPLLGESGKTISGPFSVSPSRAAGGYRGALAQREPSAVDYADGNRDRSACNINNLFALAKQILSTFVISSPQAEKSFSSDGLETNSGRAGCAE